MSIRAFIGALLFLLTLLLSDANAKSEKMPSVIETGILGSGACWYDAERLIVVKRAPFKSGQESEAEGLYVLTPTKPREATRIDLSPVEPDLQKQIGDVSCHDGTILFSVPTPDRKRSRLYEIKIGERPELLVEMRGAMPQNVSMKGKYVLGNSRLATRGMFEGNDDCAMVSMKPGFRVICTDAWLVRRWPLTQYILSEYQWFDTIKIPGPDGQPKVIPNPEKQLTDKNGKPIHYAMFLRALDGNILAQLNEAQSLKTAISIDFFVRDDETYVYSPCHRIDSSEGSSDGICRYPITGKPESWEEIFRSEIPHRHKASISHPKVSRTGDIYFNIGGTKAPHHGVWKFDARTKQITQLTNPGNSYDNPTAISPDGRWVAFVRTGPVGNLTFLVQGGGQ